MMKTKREAGKKSTLRTAKKNHGCMHPGDPSHDEVMRLVQQILRTNPDLMDLKTPWDNPEDFHNKD
jgi:hypothetical protein